MKNESQRVLGRILAQTLPEVDVEMMDGAGGMIAGGPGTSSKIWTTYTPAGSSQSWYEGDGFSFDGAWASQNLSKA